MPGVFGRTMGVGAGMSHGTGRLKGKPHWGHLGRLAGSIVGVEPSSKESQRQAVLWLSLEGQSEAAAGADMRRPQSRHTDAQSYR